ncbi:MAG: manganese catalase family protein, partial [Oscillospiraceae bacterium]|nr:manganese catalase family protein [Oscillospiraceae bacterium]
EMVSAILYQLTRGLSIDEIKKSGFDTYFVDHTSAIYPVAASGAPFTATYFQSKGDIITDLTEDMAADAAVRQTRPSLKADMLKDCRASCKIFLDNLQQSTAYMLIFLYLIDRTGPI